MQLDLLDRKSLIGSLPHGGIGAEIGVATGGFSQVILEVNQPRELWLVDIWHHQDDGAYGIDPANAAESVQEGYYHAVVAMFADRPHVHVLREWSLAAAATFPDEYFDWWYIDANHLQVEKDLAAWWPKLRHGGWGTGHDYTEVPGHIDVKPKVNAFAAEHGLELFIAGLKSENVYERNYPSWCARKP